jgi:hypothetical protein
MKRSGLKEAVRFAGVLAGSCALALAAGCGKPDHRNPKAEAVSKLPAEKAPLASGKFTMVYHTRDCRYAREIADKELIGYDNPDQAERAGRIPCAVCHPRESFAASDEAVTQNPKSEKKPAP